MIPETIEKRYYSIGEVAQRLNKKASAIRFWCEEFGMNPKRSANGSRKFTQAEYEKLCTINAHTQAKKQYSIRILKTIL